VRAEAVRLVKNDQTRFLPLGMVLTSLLLILLYRSIYEVAVPMLSVGLSAGYTVGLMSLFEVPIDILSNVLPLLVMVYGVADAVHLLGRVHEQMRRGEARDLAIRTAVRHLGLACLLTSATTSIGFASLLTGSMNILRRFGLFAAVGVMVAYVVTLVIAPLGVSLRPQRALGRSYVAALPWLDRLLSRIADLTIARRGPLLVLATLLVGGTIYAGSRVEVNNYLLGIYHDDNPTAIATRLAERKLEGVVRLQVSLQGKPGSIKDPAVLEAMQQLQDWLKRRPEVTSTLSLATYVGELHRVIVGRAGLPETREGVASLLLMAEGEERINRFVDYPYSKARILIGMRDVGARRYLPLVREVQRRLPPLFSKLGIEARVTGTSLVAYRGIDRLVYDLLKSLSVAFVIIGALLAIVFRSLKIGLLSLIPNVLPLTTGLGYMAIVGMRLEPATVIVFSIAFGIAVDDTIHFFARYREEIRSGATPEDAVRSTLRTAGRAMVFTSLVLITGFSVTLTSNFTGSAHFGELGGVILATALVTDLLVTPSCLLVFRPWGSRLNGRRL
jgi:predicted RND superfamily exporter protein